MRAVKKWLAFMLAAGLMVSAMTVFAEDSSNSYGYDGDVMGGEDGGSKSYSGNTAPTADNGLKIGDFWWDKSNPNTTHYLKWDGSRWVNPDSAGGSSSDSGSDSDSKSAAEKAAEAQAKAEEAAMQAAQAQASREAVALAGAASDEGFADIGDMYRASQKSMSAGEFYNNVVVSTPGIENAVTVGQGGNLVVNGQVTNMSASIGKVTNRAYVDSVRIEQEGTVLNVVEVSYPAVEATINFYMPGITGEENIVALQYNAGTWVNVEVAEIRADHVTLNMKGNGVVAFIAK